VAPYWIGALMLAGVIVVMLVGLGVVALAGRTANVDGDLPAAPPGNPNALSLRNKEYTMNDRTSNHNRIAASSLATH
jgi:hypothetical protein